MLAPLFTLALSTGLAAAGLLPAPPWPPQPRSLVTDAVGEVRPATVHSSVEELVGFGTRHTLSDTTSPKRGIGAARLWIKAQFELASANAAAAGRPPLNVSLEEFDAPPGARVPQGAHIVNVVAVLPGAMPQAAARRYYIVGHYDSRNGDQMDVVNDAPGANDDASGVAAVIECARVLSRFGPFDSTIVFLATAGEEQSLLGAKYHAEQCVARGETILGVLNNDIVGDPSSPEGMTPTPGAAGMVRIFSEGIPRMPPAGAEKFAAIRSMAAESDSASRQLSRFVAEVGEMYTAGTLPVRPYQVFRTDRFLRGGDHLMFLDNGFPAVRFTEFDEDYSRQHVNITNQALPNGQQRRYGDLPEFVDANYLAGVTKLNAAVLIHLANAPTPPPHARVITSGLTNATVIRWDSSPEPDVAGYAVVWRDTTSPVWQFAQDVGLVNEATLPMSKDNVIFGVRAYDRSGYSSPVSTLVPSSS